MICMNRRIQKTKSSIPNYHEKINNNRTNTEKHLAITKRHMHSIKLIAEGRETMRYENAPKGAISRLPAHYIRIRPKFRIFSKSGPSGCRWPFQSRTFVRRGAAVHCVAVLCFVPITTTLVCETKQWTWSGRQSSDVNWIRVRKNPGRIWVSLS